MDSGIMLCIPRSGETRLFVNLGGMNSPTKAKLNSRAKVPVTNTRSQQWFCLLTYWIVLRIY